MSEFKINDCAEVIATGRIGRIKRIEKTEKTGRVIKLLCKRQNTMA